MKEGILLQTQTLKGPQRIPANNSKHINLTMWMKWINSLKMTNYPNLTRMRYRTCISFYMLAMNNQKTKSETQ